MKNDIKVDCNAKQRDCKWENQRKTYSKRHKIEHNPFLYLINETYVKLDASIKASPSAPSNATCTILDRPIASSCAAREALRKSNTSTDVDPFE